MKQMRPGQWLAAVLIVAALPAGATLENGDFARADENGLPAGWEVRAEGYQVSLDADQHIAGPHSLRIVGAEGARGAIVQQSLAAGQIRIARHRLSGMIRTEGIETSATLVLIVVDENGATLFSDDMIDRVVRGNTDWMSYAIDVPVLPDAVSVSVGALVIGAGTAWFDRMELEQMPDNDGATTEDLLAYVEHALDMLEAQYVAGENIDWDRLRSSARDAAGHALTMSDAHAVLAAAISRLGDSHASFVRPQSSVAEDSEPGAVGPIEVVQRGERLRLVTVPGIDVDPLSTDAAEYVDGAYRAIEAVDSEQVCGWMVDLRESGGGTMWPRLAALGPILDEGELGSFVGRDPDEIGFWFYRDGEAGVRTGSGDTVRTRSSRDAPRLENVRPPVAVLISPHTASAGEMVAVAFIGRERTRLFGEATFGHASANGTVPLPDGAMLVFPMAYAADRNGTVHFPSVLPDVPVLAELTEGEAEQWLLAQPECGPH